MPRWRLFGRREVDDLPKLNAAGIVAALAARHPAPEWVTVPEAPNGKWSPRRCDLLAMHSWPSRGYEVHGYEVKISKADWAKELASPEKAESWWRWCDRWSLAVPAEAWGAISRAGDAPVGWGVVTVDFAGKVKWQRQPSLVGREPWPWGLMAVMLSTVDRRRDVELQQAVGRATAALQTEMRDLRAKLDVVTHNPADRQLAALRDDVRLFEETSGIKITGQFGGIDGHVAQLIPVLRKHFRSWDQNRLGQIVAGLRIEADRMEKVMEELGLPPAPANRRLV